MVVVVKWDIAEEFEVGTLLTVGEDGRLTEAKEGDIAIGVVTDTTVGKAIMLFGGVPVYAKNR